METIIDSQHGTTVLLAGIIIVSCLHLLAKLGEMILKRFEKKQEASEKNYTEVSLALQQNTNAVRELRIQLSILERELGEIHKFKVDFRKLFAAVKIVAGPKWAEIKKEIADEDIPK